jgi:uridylate kinase
MNKQPVYRRILLKLSGEALAPSCKCDGILDFAFIDRVVDVIKKCHDAKVEIGVIVGAGNIWRGKAGAAHMERSRADHMGMLATVMNSLALQDSFIRAGLDTVVMSAVEMDAFADHYNARTARKHLADGKIVIFAGGMGSPYFSTDTAAVLRAAEIEADAILMAKNVDYLYDSDPNKNRDAKPIYDITYADILARDLRAFDMSAVLFCQDNDIEAYGFGLADPENIYRAVMGEPVGTKMHN